MADAVGSVETGNPEAPAAPAAPAAPVESVESVAAVAPTPTNLDLATIQNEDLRGWAETKGFQNGTAENVLNSYHNLEKLFGADRAGHTITLPTDDATPEQRGEFFTKLGRPGDATGYGLKPAEGEDTQFAEWAGAAFHKAGLSTAQAGEIAEAWAEFSGGHIKSASDQSEINATNAVADLKKEWGAAYDQNVAGIERTAAALGMTGDQLVGLRTAMGPKDAMLLVHSLGMKIGDDTFEGGENRATGVMTPAQAKATLDELMGSEEFSKAWLDKMHPNHKNVVSRKSELSRLIAGELPVAI